MELSVEPKQLIEESALPAFSYLYSEYTSFADELTKRLIEQFP